MLTEKIMIYIYDGSYQGFMSVVYANYYQKRADEVIGQEQSTGFFLDENKEIQTNPEYAARVEKALYEKCGQRVMEHIYYAFHSSKPEKDTWLLRFIELAFKIGENIKNALSETEVLRIYNLSKKVSRERHSFLGFVRFEEIEDNGQVFLYSGIEPENNILPLIAGHFAQRFYQERIIIHDSNRKMALLAYQGKWELSYFEIAKEVISNKQSQVERGFQKLWQGYVEHIAINERKSKKRQQQFVPLKYRKNLTEFKI